MCIVTTDLIFHDFFKKHVLSPGHPESPDRLTAAMDYLRAAGLLENNHLEMVTPERASIADILKLHSDTYIDNVREKSERGGGFFTLDTSVNRYTFDAALLAAGGGIEAVSRVMEGVSDNAFVLCRPPGHHAEHSRAFGFCFMNNVAIAAKYLLEEKEIRKIIILDYDAHHGNGTQNMFYDDNRVLYIGLHQDGRTLFPGSGFTNERGIKDGVGYTVNLPMYPGSGNVSYGTVFDEIIVPAFNCYKPEFVLVSSGFDCHFNDPLTTLGLTTEGIAMMNKYLHDLALHHSEGRLVYFLEGGYNLGAMGSGVLNTIEELIGTEITKYGDVYQESDNCIVYTKELVKKTKENILDSL